MKVESWPLADIRPYDQNPRRIPDAAIQAVADSITRYGFRQPIVVDSDGVIVVGLAPACWPPNGWTWRQRPSTSPTI